MSAATIDSTCALCGGSDSSLQFREGPFSVVRCRSCRLTYVTPRLRDDHLLGRVYDELYWTSPVASERGYTDYAADEELYLRTFERRVAGLEDHLRVVDPGLGDPTRGGRVLDVGCAAGYFLRVMRERGWDVVGVEPSQPMRDVARRTLGIERVHAGLLEEAPLEPGSFDLVCFWDVLEHLPDPVEALRAASALLRPGGRVLVETQNVASLFARVLGRRWQHYKHAEHLWHFDPRTLHDAFVQAGLRTNLMSSRHAGKYVSTRFVRERARRLGPVARLLAAPLALLGDRTWYVNPHDELIAVATRD